MSANTNLRKNKKSSLSGKLGLGFGIIIVIIIINIVYTTISTMNMNKSFNTTLDAQSKVEFIVSKEVDHLLWVKLLLSSIIAQEQFTGQLDHTQCAFGKWYYSEDINTMTERERDAFKAIEEPHIHLHQSAIAINEAIAEGNNDKAFAVFENETDASLQSILSRFAEYITIIKSRSEFLQTAASEAQKITTHRLIILSAIGFASIIFTLIFAIAFTKSIVSPINQLVQFIDKITSGDLSGNISIKSNDEIAVMANAMNSMKVKLASIVNGINEAAQQVSSSSEELSSTAELLSEGAQNQANIVEETVAAIEELSTSVEHVSSSTEEQTTAVTQTSAIIDGLVQSIKQVSELAGNVQSGANHSVALATDAVQSAHEAISGMKEIQDSSKQMSAIVAVIQEIADSTSLLALNASIEAAHAGDAGHGFAVVAESVSKLAERSAASSKEIEKLILDSNNSVNNGSAIVQKVTGAIERMQKAAEDAAQMANNIANSALEQTESSNQIVNVFKQVNTISQSISLASKEQNINAHDMSATMEKANEITQQVASSAEEMASSTEELSAQAVHMSEIISYFKI